MDMKKEVPYGNTTTERAADEAALRETQPAQAISVTEGGDAAQSAGTVKIEECGTRTIDEEAERVAKAIVRLFDEEFKRACTRKDSLTVETLSEANFAKVLDIYRKIPQRDFLYSKWLSIETEAESYKSTPGQPGSPEAPAE